jgi:hypothetical protein
VAIATIAQAKTDRSIGGRVLIRPDRLTFDPIGIFQGYAVRPRSATSELEVPLVIEGTELVLR